jgi:tetratricopeptide (TPR) repeat protein
VISWENDLSTYEEKSVAATFASQLDGLERQCPNASDLLKVLSFFDPESIPLGMITQGAEVLSGKIAQEPQHEFNQPQLKTLLAVIVSPIDLHDAITQLQKWSLVKHQRIIETSVLRIHDLTKIMVQSAMKNSLDRKWFKFAAQLACGAFKLVENPRSHKCWVQCEIFVSHLQSLTTWDEIYRGENMSIMTANSGIAKYFRSCGRYSEAEAMLDKVRSIREKLLGPEHPDTLASTHELAGAYFSQGRYDEARTLCERVLAIRQKQLGTEHLDTLRAMRKLANIYIVQKEGNEAETLCKQVLVIAKHVVGEDHSITLDTMHSLAGAYRWQRRYSEAEALYQSVLTISTKRLGSEHENTLATMRRLAEVYHSQGRHNEAETLLGRVLAVRKKNYGIDHPRTLTVMHSLANVYHSLQRYSDAETLLGRVLAAREKKIGAEHPDTLHAKRNLDQIRSTTIIRD